MINFKSSHPFLATFLLLVGVLFMVNFASALDWSNNLTAYYAFDTGSGIVAVDSSPNSYDLDGTNTPGWTVSGKIGGATDLENTSSEYWGSNEGSFVMNGSMTINVWMKKESYNPFMSGVSKTIKTSNGDVRYLVGTVTNPTTTRATTRYLGGSQQPTGTDLGLGTWYMATQVINSTGVSLWINGTMAGYVVNSSALDTPTEANPFLIGGVHESGVVKYHWDGMIDEVSIWDRGLSASEISELWNSGAGLAYSASPYVTLEVPTNESTLSSAQSNFTASGNNISSVGLEWTNATYHIWFTNGTVHNETFLEFTDGQTFNETLLINGLAIGDYLWNVNVCYSNATYSGCSLAETNSTFEVVPFQTLAEDYLNTTISGSTDYFSINLSLFTGVRVSTIDFVYNGTSSGASFTEYETGKYFVSYLKNIPSVLADTNLTFYWAVELEGGSEQNSTLHNQTVQNLLFDNCSVYTTVIFNFTVVDEDTQVMLNGVTDNTSVKVDLNLSRLDSSGLFTNFSSSYVETNPAAVCTNVDLDSTRFRVDGVVEYSALNKFVEFYNIQNYTLTNTTANQNITLYNLNSSLGQEFKITYKDADFNLVPGAIIQIQRKYIDEGVFKTVEIPMISGAGYTIAHLVRNDIIYNLVVIKEGVVLATFTDVVADCQNPTFTECAININSFSTGISPEDFSTDGEFTSTLSYNKTTRIVSTTFAILSGIPAITTLEVFLWDAYSNTTICSDSLTAAGGTLSCTIPDTYGNSSIIIKLTSGGELKRSAIVILATDPDAIYGNSLVFIGLLIILLIIGMSVSDNPMTLGIMLVFGTIVLIVLNIVSSSGWLGGGATILWFIIAVVILLIKGSNRQ